MKPPVSHLTFSKSLVFLPLALCAGCVEVVRALFTSLSALGTIMSVFFFLPPSLAGFKSLILVVSPLIWLKTALCGTDLAA